MDTLDADQLEELRIECGQLKSDSDKAVCILDWQEENLFYCNEISDEGPVGFVVGYGDCSVDMVMNEIVPGSFPVSKVMELKTRDGKIFGQCYTYATTYCAVARSLGLECRVMATKTRYEERVYPGWLWRGPGYCGQVAREFVRANDLKCLDWFWRNWEVGPMHYWPEVAVDSSAGSGQAEWRVMTRDPWRYGRDGEEKELKAIGDFRDMRW